METFHENSKPILCNRCPKNTEFSQPNLLFSHIEIDHEGLRCYICLRKFGRKSKLIIHVEKIHSDVGSHECENVFDHDCEKSFELYSDLRKHIMNDHIMPEFGFEPDEIDEETKIEDVISSNSSYNPDDRNVKKYKCELCFKVLARKDNMRRHMKTFHEAPDYEKYEEIQIEHVSKNLRCSMCEKMFSTVQCLKRHIDSIHATKKFRCKICCKEFGRKDNIMAHIRKLHKAHEFDNYEEAQIENILNKSPNNPDLLNNFTHFMAIQKPEVDLNLVSQNDKNHTVGQNFFSKNVIYS